MKRKFNDYKPETKDLIDTLIAAGYEIAFGNNGGDDFNFTNDVKFIEELTACDEAKFRIIDTRGDRKGCTLYLVFGNSCGELVSDYSYGSLFNVGRFEMVLDEVGKRWDGKEVPTYEEEWPAPRRPIAPPVGSVGINMEAKP
jgi:hypothetical protein